MNMLKGDHDKGKKAAHNEPVFYDCFYTYAGCFFCLLFLLGILNFYERQQIKYANMVVHHENLTIRLNTFRRLDLLEKTLDYYTKCDFVSQIQIIWSDQQNKPPYKWVNTYGDKVIFEEHPNDSLNNRFLPRLDIPTRAVLSIDDDLIIPCDELARSLNVWSSNKQALVGFSSRMVDYNVEDGLSRYLNWQFTWWSGSYSIMLTKAALLDRKYLYEYPKIIPQEFFDHIDKMRNCEDIAMAYAVALQTNAAPVWTSVIVYEIGGSGSGISSGGQHFDTRSDCLNVLQGMMGGKIPWVTGYQKMSKIYITDIMKAWRDTK